jgi:hypothetical protein
MVRIACATFFILALILSDLSQAAANESLTSGRTGLEDNPFIAYGVNPKTQLVTGYLIGLRTAPGRTNECRLIFFGRFTSPDLFIAKFLSEVDGFEQNESRTRAVVQSNGGHFQMIMKKDQMGGDCEWILPFINQPRVKESGGEVEVSFGKLLTGRWIGVFAIRSERAPFYQTTEESSVRKAFLVQGDLVYVYDEKPGWYYVKYEGRNKTTVGWIKKSDTVQIEFDRAGRH